MTILLKLRNAAKDCSNKDYSKALRLQADEIAGRLTIVHHDPTDENMQSLNGVWSKASRLLKNIPPEGDPAPLGGDAEPARLAA